jgi:hypothetical protein
MSWERYIWHQEEGKKPCYGVFFTCDKCGKREDVIKLDATIHICGKDIPLKAAISIDDIYDSIKDVYMICADCGFTVLDKAMDDAIERAGWDNA